MPSNMGLRYLTLYARGGALRSPGKEDTYVNKDSLLLCAIAENFPSFG